MESGRKWKGWKNLGGAGLLEKGIEGGGVWEGVEGRLGGCHLRFPS